MPKSKFDKYANPVPPIDWLWGAILERKMVLRLDLKAMAKLAGVSYDRMRRLINQSPWEWPRAVRDRVCKELGVNISVTPQGIKLEEER